MELKEVQRMVYAEYIHNDYLNSWNVKTMLPQNHSEYQKKFDIAELALISSEVTEAIEEIREKETHMPLLGLELADIVIRTLNFASRKGIDLESCITAKHEQNMKREKLHGKDV